MVEKRGNMFQRIKSEVKYFSQLGGLPVYGLSHLSKRDPGLWVFGSTFGRRFADNPKYFYLYLNQYHKEIRAVWISHDPEIVRYLQRHGLEAYHYQSKEGRKLCLKAGVYVYDNYSKDISFLLSGGALKVNLWHGVPLKKIQMDNIFDKVRHPENKLKKLYWSIRRLSDEKPEDYVLTTSKFLKGIFSSAFATEHVLTSGYPRNDSFYFKGRIKNLRMPSEMKLLHELGIISKEKEIRDRRAPLILYMPTFRESEELFFERTDVEKLKGFLEDQGISLLVKLHPKSKLFEKFRSLSSRRIFLLGKDDDPYEFVKYADALITDYSSIYFDYLLKDYPIIFYHYDYEEYLSMSRELYFDYNEVTPGQKAASGKELLEAIARIQWDAHTDGYEKERKELREKIFDDLESPASERLFQDIRQVLKNR